jgi:hypothetical protein
VQTIGLILLSGYSISLRISSIVCALSFDAYLHFGKPLVIFFHEMFKSVHHKSLMIFNDFTNSLKVAAVISLFSTLFF